MNTWVYFLIGFLVLDFLIVIYIVIKRRKTAGFAVQDLHYILNQWGRIENSVKSDAKHSILDADKILDFALKKKGYDGSVADKLKRAAPLFSDLKGLWAAHRLRNRIAHEIIEVSPSEANSALRSFKRALVDLGVKF